MQCSKHEKPERIARENLEEIKNKTGVEIFFLKQ